MIHNPSDIIQKILFPFPPPIGSYVPFLFLLLLSNCLLCCAAIIHLLLLSSLSLTFSLSFTPFLLFLYPFHTFIFSPHFFPSLFPSLLFVCRLVIFLSISSQRQVSLWGFPRVSNLILRKRDSACGLLSFPP